MQVTALWLLLLVALCHCSSILKVWGDNSYGQLGIQVRESRKLFVPKPMDFVQTSKVKQVSAGRVHTLVLLEDGTVYATGYNQNGELGDRSTVNRYRLVPCLATTAKNITQIAAGYYHSLALSSEGKVFAWGKNDVGQLGIIDSNPFSLLPVTVAIPGKILISQISTTSTFSVALGINNVIYGWGNNSNGVLNMSSEQVSFNVPIVIYNNTKQVKTVIALAETIVVLFFDGDVYTFGKSNINGALGRFNSTSLLVLQDIIEISASGYSNIARRSDGKILMWGLNDNNQFLYFSVNQIPAPVLSTMETDTRVFMGAFHAFYIRKNEMFVTAAGANEFGQRGDGTMSLTMESTRTSLQVASVDKIVCGQQYSIAIMKDGSLMSWGNNDHGQLGRLSDYYAKPVSVVLSITVLTITTGGYHTMLISTYNYVYGFGSNSMFQLGAASDKRYSDRLVFVDSIVGATFIATGQEHTLCVANKTVFAWGSNLSGQLGFSKYQVGVAPQEIKSFLDIPIKHVAAGHQHSLALSHQGDVYAWGSGMFGAVGDNEATDIIRPTPKLVALGTFTTRIAAAGRHSMALSSDGTIYTWGLNIAGQLGDGTTTNRYRSVRVTPVCSQERSYYDFIAAGASNIMGVVSGGASVHTSGTNSHWQLGIGRLLVTNQQSSPVIVRDIKEKIIAVAMSGVASYEYYPNPLDIGAGYAVTNKGSVYAWGSNEFGLLGEEQVPEIKLSTTTQVNIGVGHNVTQISAYGSFVVTLANCAPGYSGDNCDVFECFGISSTSKSACSGNGTCVAPDTCNCGYYKGRNCETWTCGYMNHSDSSVCKGHGKCISIDTCLCEKSYTGSPYCDPVCFGKNFEESCNRDNGANNTCIAPNTCECRDGFGLECKLPLWVLITIILGGIIIFCIVMVPTTSAIAFFSIKRRQKKKRISEMNMFLLGDDTKEMLSLENMIQYDDLEFKEKIASGTFGVVFRGEYQSAPVAIKMLINDNIQVNEFAQEVQVLKQLRHPNIVLFMGICVTDNSKYIVTELMSGNSLQHAIHKLRGDSEDVQLHKSMPLSKKIDILTQVVQGLVYLHNLSPPLLHRDIKPSNILLDRNHTVAKLCDFGTAKAKQIDARTMTGSIGTFLYMAPEILSNQRTYDESCDVYSFAVVMYELLFETAPFASEDTTSTGSVFQLGMSILQGRRPAIPIAVYNEQELGLIEIMKACWSQNPEDRPTFKNVFMELEKVKIN